MGSLNPVTLAVLVVLISSHNGYAQQPMYEVRIGNLLKMQEGVGSPSHLLVMKGNDALLRLSNIPENMQECKITTPAGIQFNARNPPNNRYEFWSTSCGLRVKNMTESDQGRWRLIASSTSESTTGWTELNVTEDITSYTPPDPIPLQDGGTHAEVNLTSLQNSYCLVTQPFSESSLVSGHCLVTLDRTTRAVQGRWGVVLGLPGRVSELQMERNVVVETEQLVSGYREESSKIHLYCNIMHTEKNITFCRFQKNSEPAGYNFMDGLSDGQHSYYGDGFAKRHCGMTIERPDATDYGTWRCTVGMHERSNNRISQSAPMQALIRVLPQDRSLKRSERAIQTMDEDIRTLFVQQDTNLMIMCRAEESLAYCWFQHPNGTQFTPVERQLEEQREFWYTGESLQTGDCGITITRVSENDSGEWTCHMGPKKQLGVEVTDKVIVRITGPLAASKQEINARIGGEVVLYCQTSNGPRPLDYCRFLMPNYVGISIDSSVTDKNAILDRFYFTPERSLDYGDCSLTINPVTADDIGTWTCAGLVHDHVEESRDSIVVNGQRSAAAKAGIVVMSIALGGLVIVLAGVIWYRKGRHIPWRRTNMSDNVAFSFGTRNSTPTPRSSNSTDTNDNQSNTEVRITGVRDMGTTSTFSLETPMASVNPRKRNSIISTSSSEISVRPH